MEKKLCISLIFSNFVVSKHKVKIFHSNDNLYGNFAKGLEICKDFSKNLVNELGNIPRPGKHHPCCRAAGAFAVPHAQPYRRHSDQ